MHFAPLADLAGGHRDDSFDEVQRRSRHDQRAHLAVDGITGLPAREVFLGRLVQHEVGEQRTVGHLPRRAQDLGSLRHLVAAEHVERMHHHCPPDACPNACSRRALLRHSGLRADPRASPSHSPTGGSSHRHPRGRRSDSCASTAPPPCDRSRR